MKKKILLLSDHALSTSGVGTQSRHLINGLVKKGTWTVRQFGAAIRHENYDIAAVNEDFIIKPVDGFGTVDLIRQTIAAEKPDVLMLFTDPRFFVWLWSMEDEIHQMCPIAYWHVWDNGPFPEFNAPFYEATDLINCHSHMTYELIKDRYPGKVNFVPHALPDDVYYKMTPDDIIDSKIKALGYNKKDTFVAFWMNRNARRKRPNDVLEAWKMFIDRNTVDGKKPDAVLLMHTDPQDGEGPNLFAAAEVLGIADSLIFSTDRVDFSQINTLHNISDVCINMSYAEGFGLATLEAMQAGTPIIAAKTGGLTRQVVDHRDGTENGVAVDIKLKSLVGSQQVPYIYEDYVDNSDVADAITKIYKLSKEEKEELSEKVQNYVKSEFSFQKTIDDWDKTLNDLILNWRENYNRVVCEEIK
jgi:glycosyltransferase involved in cell wall biosynthesis